MDAELKAKWIAALRSGVYGQGMTALRTDDNEYCCLGVLCDVADPTMWAEDDYACWTADGRDDLLTGRLLATFGLTESEQQQLSEMNDTGATFAQIASFVEANL